MNGVQRVIKVFAICLAVIIIVNIFGWIILGISFFAKIGDRSEKSSTIETEDRKEFVYTEEQYQKVNNIDIDIQYAELIIETGSDTLKVGADGIENNVKVELENKTLKIKEKDSWNWNWGRNETGIITINIPDNIDIQELDIDTGAGKVKIDGVYAKEIDIDHGAGKLEIVNSKFDKTNIDAGAGETVITSSTLSNLKLDAGVGKVKIESEITGDSNIECGVGELDISINGKEEDYKILAARGLGSLKINGSEQGEDVVYGSGTNVIKVDGGIGSISIDFTDKEN